MIQKTQKIISLNGGTTDASLASRVTTLENNESKVLYWASVSSASGTITIPTGATILLDQLQGGVDAYPSTISAGQPTGDFPQTSGAAVVTVSSFDTSGNYTLSGTPSAFPVALVYLLKISALNWSNLTTANILEDDDYNLFLNGLQVGNGVVNTSGICTTLNNTGGIQISNVNTAQGSSLTLSESSTKFFRFTRNNTTVGGNYSGTSILMADTGNFQAGNNYQLPFIFSGTPIYNIIGTTSTNYGTILDAVGLRVDQLSNLHTTNSSLNRRAFSVNQDTSTITMGSWTGGTANGAIYINTTTPGTTNFTFLGDGTNSFLNAPLSNGVARIGIAQNYVATFAVNTITLSPLAATSGAPKSILITTPASSAQTTLTETIGIDVDMATNSIQHATGAITTNRDFLVRARTHTFVAASTITDAGTLVITNAPQAGTNATITNAYALWTQAGKIRFQGLPTSSAGLQAGDVYSNAGILTIV